MYNGSKKSIIDLWVNEVYMNNSITRLQPSRPLSPR